jgi:hypothetical protein
MGLETVLFPLSTFMMSAYEGSLLAILLTTLALTVFALNWGQKFYRG